MKNGTRHGNFQPLIRGLFLPLPSGEVARSDGEGYDNSEKHMGRLAEEANIRQGTVSVKNRPLTVPCVALEDVRDE